MGPQRLMLMLDFCTDIIILITMVTTTDTRDFSGDVRSVRPMLKLPPRLMLMLVFSTILAMPMVTTMDTLDFSGNARSVRPMLKLPLKQMPMLDFCTVHTILTTTVATTAIPDFSGAELSAD